MDRRAFLADTGAVLIAAPLAAQAEQADRVFRIGVLGHSSASASAGRIEAFRQGLRDLGYVEGKNVALEYRWSEGKQDRLPELAKELVRRKVDVIVTHGVGVSAAKDETRTIPIVMAVTATYGRLLTGGVGVTTLGRVFESPRGHLRIRTTQSCLSARVDAATTACPGDTASGRG